MAGAGPREKVFGLKVLGLRGSLGFPGGTWPWAASSRAGGFHVGLGASWPQQGAVGRPAPLGQTGRGGNP